MKRPSNFKEEDLYEPLRKWLVNNGYAVQAEVVDCDIVAQQDGEIHVLELKKAFSLQLVYQCLERQKLCDFVYAAIPIPKGGKRGRSLRNATTLMKKLGIGLFVVHLYTRNSMVELIVPPKKVTGRKNARKKNRVLNEISKRSGNYNKGGKAGKIITAYREASIHLVLLLMQEIETSPAKLVKRGGPPNAGNILRDNHYGWFHKTGHGKYTFDVDIEKIKEEYGEVVDYYEGLISKGE